MKDYTWMKTEKAAPMQQSDDKGFLLSKADAADRWTDFWNSRGDQDQADRWSKEAEELRRKAG